jgi:hypothetical protein
LRNLVVIKPLQGWERQTRPGIKSLQETRPSRGLYCLLERR